MHVEPDGEVYMIPGIEDVYFVEAFLLSGIRPASRYQAGGLSERRLMQHSSLRTRPTRSNWVSTRSLLSFPWRVGGRLQPDHRCYLRRDVLKNPVGSQVRADDEERIEC